MPDARCERTEAGLYAGGWSETSVQPVAPRSHRDDDGGELAADEIAVCERQEFPFLQKPFLVADVVRLARAALTGLVVIATIGGSEPYRRGPVAQLGARLNGIQEVTGSIPVRSTNLPPFG